MAYARRQQGPKPTQSEPFSVVDDVDERLTRGKAPAVFEEDRFPLLAIGVPRIATDLDTRSVLVELKHKKVYSAGWARRISSNAETARER